MNDERKAEFLEVLRGGDEVEIDALLERSGRSRLEFERVRLAHEALRAIETQPAGTRSRTTASTPGDGLELGTDEPKGRPLVIPGYTILEPIGHGGMGDVFHAVEEATGEQVAMKVFRGKTTRTARERFLREAGIIRALRSPNIVALRSSGESHGTLYHVMELLEGETLAARIARWGGAGDSQHLRDAAETILEVCSALDIVHGRGIIHRDLKPANIFITEDGQAKLIDFGLARDRGEESLTQSGAIVGTLVYMSPEQLLGDRRCIDRRTDVYSLGATLYEAVTLRKPYEEEIGALLIPRILSADPRPPGDVNASIPEDLCAIIEKAMEFDPARRYATTGELALDLNRFLSGERVAARRAKGWSRMSRYLRRRKRGLVVILGVLLLLLLLGTMAFRIEVARQHAAVVDSALERSAAAQEAARKLTLQVEEEHRDLAASEKALSTLDLFERRRPVLEARERWQELKSRARKAREESIFVLQRGLEEAPREPRLMERLQEVLRAGFLAAEASRDEEGMRRNAALMASYFPSSPSWFDVRGSVLIESDPLGAEAFLFRYEQVRLLLQPVPYLPARGTLLAPEELPEPELRVVGPASEKLSRFSLEPGTRILEIGDEPVGLSGIRRLAVTNPGAGEAPIVIERDGHSQRFMLPAWVDGVDRAKSVMTYLNAASEMDAFPLAFLASGAVGVTPVPRFDLPSGSYLLVLRLAGHPDTRIPFQVDRGDHLSLRARLFKDSEIPPGFVHVPAGEAWLGGDPMAFYPEPERREFLPDYFIARYELSGVDYLAFLNDPRIRAEIQAGGKDPLESGLLPFEWKQGRREPRFRPVEGGCLEAIDAQDNEWGVRFVTRLAAERYVSWRNEIEAASGPRWTFALASSDELEKAGRGADRRLFPWGNVFDWSLTSSHPAVDAHYNRRLRFPTDASPYDVRDLAGGLAEITRTDDTPPGSDPAVIGVSNLDCRVKGGSGFDDLEPFFHLGGSTKERKREASYRLGFRLVAYPSRPAPVPAQASTGGVSATPGRPGPR